MVYDGYFYCADGVISAIACIVLWPLIAYLATWALNSGQSVRLLIISGSTVYATIRLALVHVVETARQPFKGRYLDLMFIDVPRPKILIYLIYRPRKKWRLEGRDAAPLGDLCLAPQ